METKFFDSSLFSLSEGQWQALAPYLWLCVGLFIGTLYAAFRGSRAVGRILGVVIFGVFSYYQATHLGEPTQTLFSSGMEVDSVTRLIGGVAAFFALLASALSGASHKDEEHAEWLPLLIISVLGVSLLPAARDFVSFFVYLETFAISGYIMTALDTGRKESLEAGIKYLLMGAFASALFLMGATLLYGVSGSFDFEKISLAVRQMTEADRAFFVMGAGLIVCALLFKVGVVPFHMWSPDVYQAAPTGVAAYLASATKISVLGSLMMVLNRTSLGSLESVKSTIFTLAVITVVAGSLLAIAQTQVKRMLAYSGIVNAGYACFALAAGTAASGAMITNLAIYGATVIAMFALVENFVSALGKSKHSDIDFREMGRAALNTHPVFVACFALGIFSLAGIPPLPGFFGKYLVLKEVWMAGLRNGVYVMLLGALLGLAYYLRTLIPLYMSEEGATSSKRFFKSLNMTTIAALFAIAFSFMMLAGLNRFPAWGQLTEVLIR